MPPPFIARARNGPLSFSALFHLNNDLVRFLLRIQKDLKGPREVAQGKLVGNEGLEIDFSPFDQFDGPLKIPAVPTASPDLDLPLNEEVDGEANVFRVFEEADQDGDPALFQALGALLQRPFKAYGLKGTVNAEALGLFEDPFHGIFPGGIDRPICSEGSGGVETMFLEIRDKDFSTACCSDRLEEEETDPSSAEDGGALSEFDRGLTDGMDSNSEGFEKGALFERDRIGKTVDPILRSDEEGCESSLTGAVLIADVEAEMVLSEEAEGA